METLAALLEQAEAQRNAALAAFNQARSRRDGAREQARDLEAYRNDYQQRWNQQFQSRGAGLDILRCYQAFADRLELALAQQAHAIEVCEQTLVRANDTLAAHELRVASVRKLIERREDEARRGAERREQRASDEMAQRIAARRTPIEGLQP
jgi:flagellar FliJ protein